MKKPIPLEQLKSQLVRVHLPSVCVNEYCVIHNPSDHHMVDWLVRYEQYSTLVMRVCPHDVDHPDPDSAHALDRLKPQRGLSYMHHEMCDGCCDIEKWEAALTPLARLMIAREKGQVTQDEYEERLSELL